jgi:hypothetical protein
LSESNTGSPLPGQGKRIARTSAEPAPDQTAEGPAEAPEPVGRRVHRAAGPPLTDLPAAVPTGGRRKASITEDDDDFALEVERATEPPTMPAAQPPADGLAPSTPTTSRRDGSHTAKQAPADTTEPSQPPTTPEAKGTPAARSPGEAFPAVEPVGPFGEPFLESPAEPTAWDRPIVTEARQRAARTRAQPTSEPLAEPGSGHDPFDEGPANPPSRLPSSLVVSWGLCAVAVVASIVAGTRIADSEGWLNVDDLVSRIGALVATWAATVLLVRRLGGRPIVIGVFAAVALGLVGGFPEPWALAGAGVTGATAFALLAMLLTRPAGGLGLLRELLVSAFVGLVGAVVVAGYDVELRPYRFRVLILAVVLGAGLVLAWRLGHGAKSIGRRGAVIIVVGVLLLASSLAYAQAVRSWGSPDLVNNLADLRDWISDSIGAAPRPIEALIGFPALVWGVAVRQRRRQGWWMCAFGALGAAGVTSSLIQDMSLNESLLSTGYDVALGAVIGLVVVLMDRVLIHGGGRRADSTADLDPERPEPKRFEPLL